MFPIKDSIRISITPVITYAIILINTVVFLYQYSLTTKQSYYFSMLHALVPRRYFDPAWAAGIGLNQHDYWPFITGVFMHGGWWHLIINMWTLFIFGSSLEGRLGRLPYLSFYLVCGVIASFTHAYFNQDLDIPTVGASGAIAGIMGAYATTFPRARVTILIPDHHHPILLQGPSARLRGDLVRSPIPAGLYGAILVFARRHCLVGAYRRVPRGRRPHSALAFRP